jgi:hypothetical protein
MASSSDSAAPASGGVDEIPDDALINVLGRLDL